MNDKWKRKNAASQSESNASRVSLLGREPAVEGGEADAENLRRLLLVAAGLGQGAVDEGQLLLAHEILEVGGLRGGLAEVGLTRGGHGFLSGQIKKLGVGDILVRRLGASRLDDARWEAVQLDGFRVAEDG